MSQTVLLGARLFATLGSGLVAGVFLAFSTFVMGALGRLPPAQGIAAMQAINVTVLNPIFMGVFMGTALFCLGLAVATGLRWSQPGAALFLAACLLYLLGTMLMTIAIHLPMNDALAKVVPGSAEGAEFWASFLSRWTLWNHVRGIAAFGATLLFILALRATR